jgi:transposase-like protein
MKKSRYSDSQIMDALKRVDAGLGVPDVCRELGISTATFYKWRAISRLRDGITTFFRAPPLRSRP